MPAGVTPEEFKACMARFASGVTVVTTCDDDGAPWGLTVSAFSSLSLSPPLCMVSIAHQAGSYAVFRQASAFAVNILSDQQEALSNRFASRRPDKFDELDWKAGPALACPILPDCLASFEVEVSKVVTAGDHDIFVGELKSGTVQEGKPLLYFSGAYGDLTSRPKSW